MKSETTPPVITQITTTVQPAAIWARVSTQDQAETSLPSQVARCQEKLEQSGFSITHILQADWSSLDLFSCPQFQELRALILKRKIEALAIYDRDRLEAKGVQRLVFISECKEAGVELVIYSGSPILDEPEGQLVEMALAIGKERQVLRAKQGAKDGLHDRAVRRRLPVSFHKVFGYQWKREKDSISLVPDEDYEKVKLIFDMLLRGSSYGDIIQELKTRGIPSPTGQTIWNRPTLCNFVYNPLYAGRYYALRKQAVGPKRRQKDEDGNSISYGNSSVKRVPLEESCYLPEILVERSPINWRQRLKILDQLAKHQKLAKRNGKRDYLLRGLIFCETHKGKGGEPRRFHGTIKEGGKFRYYKCPEGGCSHSYIEASKIEMEAKEQVEALLTLNAEKGEVFGKMPMAEATEQSISKELKLIRTEYQRKIDALAQLEEKHLLKELSGEIYERTKENLEGRCSWIKAREDELLAQLNQLSKTDDASAVLFELWEEFEDGWRELHEEDWQRLFMLLNLEIHVWDKEVVKDSVYKFKSLPGDSSECKACGSGIPVEYIKTTLLPFCEFRFGINIGLDKEIELPLDTAKEATAIVINEPWACLSSSSPS